MDHLENRLANCRDAVTLAGGISKLSQLMGYSSPSYPVQVLGPNPTRVPSEKFVRKMEQALGLAPGFLDRPRPESSPAGSTPPFVSAPPKADAPNLLNTDLLGRVVRIVFDLAAEEHANLSPDKLASLIVIGYEDAYENAGTTRDGKLRQLIQLLR